jgi:hypothetical protein
MSAPFRRWRTLAAGVLLAVTALAAAAAALWVTDQAVWQHRPPIDAWEPIRAAALALAAACAVAAFFAIGLRAGLGARARGMCASMLSAWLTIVAMEAVFPWVARSHNVGYTMASHVWFERHWGVPNALGYRDREHAAAPGKKLVFCVGDSFTAGGGIADPADRFSDRLAAARPDLHVLNLGRNGADTVAEYRALTEHPLEPDAVVLQYYPNDLEGAAVAGGVRLPEFVPYEDIPSVKLRVVVRGSYLANFLYWLFPHADGRGYVQSMDGAQRDEAVLGRHLADLQRFVEYSRRRDVPLVVVLFPVLNDSLSCESLLARAAGVFRAAGIRVIEVADLVRDVPIAARVANPQDAHASELVHARVADALVQVLSEVEALRPVR